MCKLWLSRFTASTVSSGRTFSSLPSSQNAFGTRFGGPNWRQFLGAGYFGDTPAAEWEPDEVRGSVYHRDPTLAKRLWKMSSFGDDFSQSSISDEGDLLRILQT